MSFEERTREYREFMENYLKDIYPRFRREPQKQRQLELLKNRLIAAENQNISRNTQRYVALTAKLDAMSPLKVLTRGYSLVQSERGEVIRSVSQTEPGERICVNVSDGRLFATVMEKKENG